MYPGCGPYDSGVHYGCMRCSICGKSENETSEPVGEVSGFHNTCFGRYSDESWRTEVQQESLEVGGIGTDDYFVDL